MSSFYQLWEAAQEKAPGRRARAIALLRDGPKTSQELMAAGLTHRFSTIIDDLRRLGYEIETRPQNGTCLHILVSEPSQKQLKLNAIHETSYHSTSHWRRKKEERLEFDSHRCCLCHAELNLEVHHWHYDLFSELLTDLTTLCADCHRRIHGNKNIHVHFPKWVHPTMFARLERAALREEEPT